MKIFLWDKVGVSALLLESLTRSSSRISYFGGGKKSPELKSAFQLSKTQDMYKSLVENWMIFQLCCGEDSSCC